MVTGIICFAKNQSYLATMPRTMLSDPQWELLCRVMLHSGHVYNKTKHRMTFEGILYRMRTGCPWRDLPEEFGRWNTVFKRFNLWSKNGVFELIFNQLSANPDPEWLFIDGSIVRAHQHSTGAASQEPQGIGKSRGGNTTKIHLVVDSGGLPGVVCGRGRNPTLRLWPAIFSGEIDVFPSERRNMGQEIGR